MNYLYTKPGCEACITARSLLHNQDYEEIIINNPLVELGIQVLFKDGLVHAPLLVKPDIGIYMLDAVGNWLLIHSLREEHG